MSIDKAIEALTHGARVWDALEALKEAKADRDRLAAEVEALREALEDCVEDSEEVLNQHLASFGENHKPQRVAAMRETIRKARAAIDAAKASAA